MYVYFLKLSNNYQFYVLDGIFNKRETGGIRESLIHTSHPLSIRISRGKWNGFEVSRLEFTKFEDLSSFFSGSMTRFSNYSFYTLTSELSVSKL